MTATTYSGRAASAFAWASRGGFFVEDDLGDAGAVAEVEEDEIAVVAAAVDPAHERYGFAGVGLVNVTGAQVATHVGALEGA